MNDPKAGGAKQKALDDLWRLREVLCDLTHAGRPESAFLHYGADLLPERGFVIRHGGAVHWQAKRGTVAHDFVTVNQSQEDRTEKVASDSDWKAPAQLILCRTGVARMRFVPVGQCSDRLF